MLLIDRISCFESLGKRLKNLSEDEFENLYLNARNQNAWFTESSVRLAIDGLCEFLEREKIENWLSNYDLNEIKPKEVGIIAAGNIPMVGFHDVLCVLLSGHHLMLKMSSSDSALMQFVIDELVYINPEMQESIAVVERLNDAEVVIATGSDNSARYFEYYFKNKPHIIRKNRTSVAVITGNETTEQLKAFGNDLFQYFGLGCRNVSKVFIPADYNKSILLDALQSYKEVIHHHKYCNNYDYNRSIYLVNMEEHLDTGFFLMKESSALVSPISVLFYETYETESELNELLTRDEEKIQCVVGSGTGQVAFGQAQYPQLSDYADGVDVMDFLIHQ